jgi:hypothetical protein
VTWRLHAQGIAEASVAVAVLSVWLRKRLADTRKELLKPRPSSCRLPGDFFLVFSYGKLGAYVSSRSTGRMMLCRGRER